VVRAIGKSNTPANSGPEKIRNLGPKSMAWLKQVGIRSLADIRTHGAWGSFLKVRKAGFKASLSLVYALAGAEDDVHWQQLDPARKAALLAQYSEWEIQQKAAKKIFAPRGGNLGASLVEQALGKSEAATDD
jgi:DNA transformation protein and related proteins